MLKKLNIRKSTIDRQWEEYLKRWEKNNSYNLYPPVENYFGELEPRVPLGRKEFEIYYLDVIKEKPEDRYIAGRKIADNDAKYSAKQISYFRSEVYLNLDKIDPESKELIIQIMKQNQTTKSWWSATDFKRNVVAIMEAYFAINGRDYLTET